MLRFSMLFLAAGLSLWTAQAQDILVTHGKISLDIPDLAASTSLWLPGSQGYPAPRLETTRGCPTQKREMDIVGLENDLFRVRFIPSFGARIYDLTWKDNGTSPLFNKDKTLFQPMANDEGSGLYGPRRLRQVGLSIFRTHIFRSCAMAI